MIPLRHRASHIPLAALFAWGLTAANAEAGDGVDRVLVNRCAQVGAGFVDLGNGVCGRISNQVRVYVYGGTKSVSMNSTQNTISNPWSSAGTSSAVMRSDTMVPGVDVTHLRVRGSLDSFGPVQ